MASSIGWWGKAESNGAPEGNRVTAGILRPAGDTSPDLEPSRGLEPRSARYRRAALPLSYDGVADRIGHDPNTLTGYALLSRQATSPSVLSPQSDCDLGGALRNRTPYRLGIHPSFQDWWPTIQPERSSKNWYARRDSNPHCRRSERRASCRLGYARLVLGARFEPALDGFSNRFLCRIGIPELVRPLGFEPRLNTF
jgi:hypothetical protein